jgi:hypothetical protein
MSALPGWCTSAALAPDEDDTSQSQQEQFPTTDAFAHIEIADGRV